MLIRPFKSIKQRKVKLPRKVLWLTISFICLADLLLTPVVELDSNKLKMFCCLGACKSNVAANLEGGFSEFKTKVTRNEMSLALNLGASRRSLALQNSNGNKKNTKQLTPEGIVGTIELLLPNSCSMVD